MTISDKTAGSTQNMSLVEMELEILDFWETKKIFQKSVELNQHKEPYIFYDGPPFATGLPHHGHLVASTIKDIVPRYWSMQGYHVLRRFGWDCHGLPIEHEIDKKLQMPASEALLKLGIKGYNDKCREIVQLYTNEWRSTISRLGRWVDFDNDYKTMDPWYMESVWWVFKQLWDKGLVYKDFKVMPVSTSLGTVLSNFEASSNYKITDDPAITVLFRLEDEDAYLATWTTTPWTLPANLAICVGSDIDYVKVKDNQKDIVLYLAAGSLSKYNVKNNLEVLENLTGRALIDRRYKPIFPYFTEYAKQGAFVVLGAEYVKAGDGTGLVHQAPAFGEEDRTTYKKANLGSFVSPVDRMGIFTAEVTDFQGQHVKAADEKIIKYINARGALYRNARVRHSYPFCYRSDTPLIYLAIESWYINVTKIKQQLLDANQKVHWIPRHIKDGRFGNWLKGARDWAVSRNRIWGTPLPIWINDKTDAKICIASRQELANYTGVYPEDLHREVVDDLTFTIKGEEGTYRRVEEVLDCWFESGSMPYAQLHYPFANKELFAKGFPAEFIAEGLDQTRGWFYTLMVLSTALFEQPAFKNVIVNGMVMAEDGKKMSKSLRNYTPPDRLMAEHGADALRLALIDSNLVKGEEQRFADASVKSMARRILLPWYNSYRFFATYAKLDKWQPAMTRGRSKNILDPWILSELQTLKKQVTQEMAEYKLYKVVPALFNFIENLTNWYIRLNRSRFWAEGMNVDKNHAYSTLYKILTEFSRVMAPFTPFMAETIYRNLSRLEGGGDLLESVHFCSFPQAEKETLAPTLEKAVRLMQDIVLLGRRKRETEKISLRTPLAKLTVIHKDRELLNEIRQIEHILKKELNVKEVFYTTEESNYISMYAKPNFPLLGKRLGRGMKKFQHSIQNLSPQQLNSFIQTGNIVLEGENFNSEDIEIFRQAKPGSDCITDRYISIVLDCTMNDALITEGWAREAVHLIQGGRKHLQLEVSDRIALFYDGDAALLKAMAKLEKYISKEVLATRIAQTSLLSESNIFTEEIDSLAFKFVIQPVAQKTDSRA